MSLKKSITTAEGTVHPNAYLKLVKTKFDYDRQRVALYLQCWHDQAAKEAGKAELMGVPERLNQSVRGAAEYEQYFALAVLEVEGVNERKQCYEYIKTKIADTTDV